jgi:hypothetical protein
MNPPIFTTTYGVLNALLRQTRTYYQLSVHVPGGRWITHEGQGIHAVREYRGGSTENVIFRGTAHAVVAWLFPKKAGA